MNQNQPTATETIEALQKQLVEAQVQAYQASQAKERADERVKQIQAALNGVQLGQKASEEVAEETSGSESE